MARVLEERSVPSVFGRDFLLLGKRDQAFWIEAALRYWRARGFPYPVLSEEEMHAEFCRLQKMPLSKIIRGRSVCHSTVGLRLANAFHPQMWHVRVHGKSPVERFDEDETLKIALRKAAKFWPNRRCWNAQCVRSVFRLLHRSRVANFRPTAARALIQRYSSETDTVLDFSAGYGGRLLGTLTLNRKYIGVDPSVAQISGLSAMHRELERVTMAQAVFHLGCAEDIVPKLRPRSVDLILTSPPYYNTERYSTDPDQSYMRYTTYAEWRLKFLQRLIAEAYRVLKINGYLVINVANVSRYQIADDAIAFGQQCFGHQPETLKMLMRHLPSRRIGTRAPFKWEPILIFQKRT